MAMRRWICSQVRINNLSGIPAFLRGRSYSSESLSQVRKVSRISRALDIVMIPPTLSIYASLIYHFDLLHLRTKYVTRKAEKMAQEFLEKLDREKFISEDAYLEMLERELNALKDGIYAREPDVFDLIILKREMAILKEKIETSIAKVNNPPQAVSVYQGG